MMEKYSEIIFAVKLPAKTRYSKNFFNKTEELL
jgi:hypothetical protein